MELIDLCCGDKKRPGAYGVDIAPGPGIDLVCDLNRVPWPIESEVSQNMLVEHGIEHVQDVVNFMRECHRVLKHGGIIHIVTPHFSSHNSYGDPTHLRHLSAFWYKPFVMGGYLFQPGCQFELVSTQVTFGKSLSAKIGRLSVRLRGLEKWERTLAFRYPGADVHTILRKI